MKKFFFGILIVLLFSIALTTGASAAFVGLVPCGGFEDYGEADVAPFGWSHYSGWETCFKTTMESVHSGGYSLKTVIPTVTKDIPRAKLNNTSGWGFFEVGKKYELSMWVNIPKGSDISGAYIMIEAYTSATGSSTNYVTSTGLDGNLISGDTGGEWVRMKLTFKARRQANPIKTLYIRCNENSVGTVYWDDLCLYKLNDDGTHEDEGIPYQERIAEGDGVNVIQNGDMESVSGRKPQGWDFTNTGEVTTANAHSGSHSAYIYGGVGAVCRSCAVNGGEKYALRAYMRTGDTETKPRIVVAFYDKDWNYILQYGSAFYPETKGRWLPGYYSFNVPDGARHVTVYFYKYGNGDMWIDDVVMRRDGDPVTLTIATDNDTTFYYTEWETGTAKVYPNVDCPDGSLVEFCITDGINEWAKKTGTLTGGNAEFTFSVTDLTEVGKEYMLSATVRTAAGEAPLAQGTRKVYRYPRPSLLDAEGNMYNNSGEKINPFIGTHVVSEQLLKDAIKTGVNIVVGGATDLDAVEEWMNICWEQGVYTIMNLYSENSKPAGNIVNRERTIATIERFKNHPALLGWQIQDEPFLQDRNNPGAVLEDLRNSYKLIRDLDPVHPTMMTADIYSADHYVDVGNCCDVILPDDYALGSGRTLDSVYGNMCNVDSAVRGRKPIWVYLQIFTYGAFGDSDRDYLPKKEELLNMATQSFFAGVDGLSYYSFYEYTTPPWQVTDTELYPGLVELYENEYPILWEGFASDAEVLAESKEDAVWYRLWKSGDKIRGVLLNRKGTTESISIPNPLGTGTLSYTLDPNETRFIENEGGKVVLGRVPRTESLTNPFGGFGTFEANKAGATSVYGWVPYDGFDEAFEASDECAHTGALSLKTKISRSVAADMSVVPRAKVSTASLPDFTPGKTYNITAWVNIPEGSDINGAYLLARTYKEDGALEYTWPADDQIIMGNTGGEWRQIKLTFTAKARKGIGELFIRCNEGSCGTVYWDDVAVREADAAGEHFLALAESGSEVESLVPGTTEYIYYPGKKGSGTTLTVVLYKDGKAIDTKLAVKGRDDRMSCTYTLTEEQVKSGSYEVKAIFWRNMRLSPLYKTELFAPCE